MGRHSAPDDYDDDSPVVLSGPPSAANRPRPGRHAGDRQDPAAAAPSSAPDPGTSGDDRERSTGLDLIENVMGAPDSGDDLPTVDENDSRTAQIEPIVDPVLDEPLPNAVTTLIEPVPAESPTPSPRPTPVAGPQVDEDGHAAGEGTSATDKDARAAAKAAGKAEKAEKAASKAADKAASKAAGKAAKRDGKPGAAGRPDARVSDLALLRTDSAARARVIAAIVVPFLLYVVVLVVLGAFDLRTVLIWIWLPLITAGVVAGLLLDLAHRAAAARAIGDLEPAAGPPAPAEPSAEPSADAER